MNARDRINQHFTLSRQALNDAQEALGDRIETTAKRMVEVLALGGKLLICGNGGSAADSMHFSSELVNKLEKERKALAAIALTADTPTLTSIANDIAFASIYSRQVQAIGDAKDMLVVFTTSGNSDNISEAILAAHELGMSVVALTGKTGGDAAAGLNSNDIELRVPNNTTTRIQEVHGLIIHCLCDLIDQQLFGEQI